MVDELLDAAFKMRNSRATVSVNTQTYGELLSIVGDILPKETLYVCGLPIILNESQEEAVQFKRPSEAAA